MFAPTSVSVGIEVSDILQEKAITGGIIIHLNCDDGKKTAELHLSDHFVVQGLDRDIKKVSMARARLRVKNEGTKKVIVRSFEVLN